MVAFNEMTGLTDTRGLWMPFLLILARLHRLPQHPHRQNSLDTIAGHKDHSQHNSSAHHIM